MFTTDDINNILNKLEERYPDAECALDHQNNYQLLIAVVLSAQTTDKSVNKITPQLFQKYPDAHSLASSEVEDVESILKSIGMYHTKTKNIRKLASMLDKLYDGKVPEDYDKLVELPGVGRKTANVVLSVGFGHQRIAVDTHVFRVANRIGLVNEKNVLKTELALMSVIPQSRWTKTHHSLIFHGRNCCNASKPGCENCPIMQYCRYFNEK